MPQTMPFPTLPVPPVALVKQDLPTAHIENVRRETREKLQASNLLKTIQRDSNIAITAGSRGMGGFVELLSGTIDAVIAAGGKPFIIPAMGSHGGATPAGQIEILKRLGVTDESVRAPVHATMETIALGKSETGAVAHLDQLASQADGVIVLGRTKTHPENREGVASGLLKMVTVGLGKQAGAREAHSHGLWESVKAVPRITFGTAKILCGVAVVENAFRQPVVIEVVPPNYDAFKESDERLLEVAKPHVAKVPFQDLDVLVIDKIGKDVSGTGMDLNVVGSWRVNGGERTPNFQRIVVLSLTHESLGNGLGIGLADFTTERFFKEYDPAVTYVNLLTATEPNAMNTREGPLPLVLPSDREAIEVALYSSLASKNARMCRIKNTARLDEFWVSAALVHEVETTSGLSILQAASPMRFDSEGNLF